MVSHIKTKKVDNNDEYETPEINCLENCYVQQPMFYGYALNFFMLRATIFTMHDRSPQKPKNQI